MLFPAYSVGLVAFVNFGSARLARLLNEHVFDRLAGFKPEKSLQDTLAQYEFGIGQYRARLAALSPVPQRGPIPELSDYVGTFDHAGYGSLRIDRHQDALVLHRGEMTILLHHWYFDAWACASTEFFDAQQPHALDAAGRVLFDRDVDGAIAGLSIPFEPSVAPIRFVRRSAP
jgi:hypothetical protein